MMTQAKTQTLSLGGYWNNFIESHVGQGRYASASELVRDGLRLLEEKEADSKLEALRAALIEGEESGAIIANVPDSPAGKSTYRS